MSPLSVDQELELAKDTFLNGDNTDFMPMARVEGEKGVTIVGLAVEGFQKWTSLANVVRTQRAWRVVFMADTWVRSIGKDDEVKRKQWEDSNMRVQDYADRIEVLMVTIITKDALALKGLSYRREGDEIIWDPDLLPDAFEQGTVMSKGAELVQTYLVEEPS